MIDWLIDRLIHRQLPPALGFFLSFFLALFQAQTQCSPPGTPRLSSRMWCPTGASTAEIIWRGHWLWGSEKNRLLPVRLHFTERCSSIDFPAFLSFLLWFTLYSTRKIGPVRCEEIGNLFKETDHQLALSIYTLGRCDWAYIKVIYLLTHYLWLQYNPIWIPAHPWMFIMLCILLRTLEYSFSFGLVNIPVWFFLR